MKTGDQLRVAQEDCALAIFQLVRKFEDEQGLTLDNVNLLHNHTYGGRNIATVAVVMSPSIRGNSLAVTGKLTGEIVHGR